MFSIFFLPVWTNSLSFFFLLISVFFPNRCLVLHLVFSVYLAVYPYLRFISSFPSVFSILFTCVYKPTNLFFFSFSSVFSFQTSLLCSLTVYPHLQFISSFPSVFSVIYRPGWNQLIFFSFYHFFPVRYLILYLVFPIDFPLHPHLQFTSSFPSVLRVIYRPVRAHLHEARQEKMPWTLLGALQPSLET